MRREHGGNIGTRPMDFVNQVCDPRSHHQEVPRFARTCVPVGMRRSPSSKYGGARGSLDVVVAQPEAKCPVEHVPRLVVPVMDVKGRDPMVTDLGRPLDDDEVVVGGPDRATEERLDLQGSDYRFFTATVDPDGPNSPGLS